MGHINKTHKKTLKMAFKIIKKQKNYKIKQNFQMVNNQRLKFV